MILLGEAASPYEHLAREDWLMTGARLGPSVCYLWRAAPALVIGKNQNPWRECRLAAAAAAGVRFCRRHSGGGAVYHDEGNLNITWITRRARYEPGSLARWLAAALAPLKLPVVARPDQRRVDLGERKISGLAYRLRGDLALQHATLLVGADLARLRACLRLPPPVIETQAIASVPASVTNLSAAAPGLTLARVQALLVAGYRELIEPAAEIQAAAAWQAPDWPERVAGQADWEWLYGHTPLFTVRLGAPPTLEIVVRQGRIATLRRGAEAVGGGWAGARFAPASLAESLTAAGVLTAADAAVLADLA